MPRIMVTQHEGAVQVAPADMSLKAAVGDSLARVQAEQSLALDKTRTMRRLREKTVMDVRQELINCKRARLEAKQRLLQSEFDARRELMQAEWRELNAEEAALSAEQHLLDSERFEHWLG